MLETYTGLLLYDQKRDDEKIVSKCLFITIVVEHFFKNEHLDEQLQSQTAFKLLYDKMAGEIEPYLAQLYFRIIKGCIIKHSKRSHSKEVCKCFHKIIIIHINMIVLQIQTGDANVGRNKLLNDHLTSAIYCVQHY